MTTTRESVVRRFAGLVASTKRPRRTDFKGKRYRINMRIGIELAIQLQILKLVTGEDKNSYCERVLGEAVARDIAVMRERHVKDAWNAIEATAKKSLKT